MILNIILACLMFTTPCEFAADNHYTYSPCEQGIEYVGADHNKINLTNYNTAENKTYEEVIQFIKRDGTDNIKFNYESFICGDYAEQVHNNAEREGIRAGFVVIEYNGSSYHALNVFNTSDRGLIFVDCTSNDKEVVDFKEGNQYTTVSMFSNNKKEHGIINSCIIFW